MARKNADIAKYFEEFWEFVAQCEQNYRSHSHTGFYPPDMIGDFCIDEFSELYERVHPCLQKFHKRRMFVMPIGLRHHPGPIKAETAHQALLFFLNPPEALHGESGVLDSPEFHEIKRIAFKELSYAQRQWQSSRVKKKPSAEARARAKLAELRSVIYDHHFPKDSTFRSETMFANEIGEKLGWSQPTGGRWMSELFQVPGSGMAVYHAVFRKSDTPKGFREKLDDRTKHVVGIWNERETQEESSDD